MKKLLILVSALLTAGALTACRRALPPTVTAEPTAPLATVKPTEETVRPDPDRTEPRATGEQRDPYGIPEMTIEDGNGPTPNQLLGAEF